MKECNVLQMVGSKGRPPKVLEATSKTVRRLAGVVEMAQ
jgi:hypothetical protein